MKKRYFYNDFSDYKDAFIKFKEAISQGVAIEEIAYCYSLPIERIISILIRPDGVIDPIIKKAIKDHYSQFTIDDSKAIIISDTHVGSYYEFLMLFDTIFNYCCVHDIKNIIHAGDLIEGNSFTPNRKNPINRQISDIISIFNQKGIPKMFYLYGNHDYNVELYEHISLKEELKCLENLIYIGKGNSYVQLNDNDPINICHHLSSDETYVPNFETNLKLEGHHHYYSYFDNSVIYLPPLSLIGTNSNLGFLELKTVGNEFIIDVYKDLKNNIINHYEQKVIKKNL